MRFLKSYGLVLLLLIGLAAWLATGTFIQGGKGPGNGSQPTIDVITGQKSEVAETKSLETEKIEKLQSVRTRTFVAEALELTVPVRGRIEADAVVSVRPETAGVVETIHVAKGDSVAAGDLLCTIDQGTRQAAVSQATSGLAQAKAALAQAEADFDTNKQLREKGVSSANSARNFEVALAGANANVQAAIANLDNAKKDIERTQVRSGIAGIVQDPVANIGDLVSNASVCATIVQIDQMRFTGKIAEAKIENVNIGMTADVKAVTGRAAKGVVSFIATSANAATRTFDVEILIDNKDHKFLDGVTAEADITLGTIPAQLLPQSILTLDSDGTLGVQQIIDGASQFTPINITRATPDGVWVAGLPTSVEIVILGQEFLVDGQKVAATNVSLEENKS